MTKNITSQTIQRLPVYLNFLRSLPDEKKKGTFVHTLRYTYKGKTIESDDRTGFSQPLRVGEKRTITVDSRDPKRFEYTDELKKNIIITAVMVCLAVVFSVKFILAGLL